MKGNKCDKCAVKKCETRDLINKTIDIKAKKMLISIVKVNCRKFKKKQCYI